MITHTLPVKNTCKAACDRHFWCLTLPQGQWDLETRRFPRQGESPLYQAVVNSKQTVINMKVLLLLRLCVLTGLLCVTGEDF